MRGPGTPKKLSPMPYSWTMSCTMLADAVVPADQRGAGSLTPGALSGKQMLVHMVV